MKTFLFLFYSMFVFSSVFFAQETKGKELLENLEFLLTNYPGTKTYVHTDKPFYISGEKIWFAVYAVNATNHELNPLSQLIYIQLQNSNGEVVATQKLKLTDKFANGDIDINEDWDEGVYSLSAYTSYMKNFNPDFIFSKEVAIWKDGNPATESKNETAKYPVKLRFFPEGGDLVAGVPSRVAYDFGGMNDEEIQVNDKKGNPVAKGKMVTEGLGFFNLIPKANESYYVEINGKQFSLPQVKTSGYSFNINALDADKIYIDILSSADVDLSNTFLIGHIRGIPFILQDQLSGQKSSFVLERNQIPEGVCQVTLFDDKGRPLIERTFFNRHQDQEFSVEAEIPFEYLNRRQRADLKISLEGASESLPDGTFSISVVDAAKVTGISAGVDIRSYLLLGSEFTEGIENINQYFSENNTKSRFIFDILMLTKGWTRFKWEDIKNRNEPEIIFPPESGFTISGQVLEKNKPVQAMVNFSIVREDLFFASIETDENGRFAALGFDLKEGEQLNVSAFKLGKNEKQITKNIRIELDDPQGNDIPSHMSFEYAGPSKSELKLYLENAYETKMMDSMYSDMQVQLDEVVLKADKKLSMDKKIKKERSIIYTNYDKRVFLDSIPNKVIFRNVFDLVRDRIPGVNIVGTVGDQRFRLRGGSNSILGSNDALVIVDGTPVSYEYVNAMNVDQIEFIDIIKGLSASAIYSTPNGVVAIYTRNELSVNVSNNEQAENVAHVLYEGYYQSREFYSPDYEKGFPGSEKPDLRTTLYWNPQVKVNQGKAELSFFTADQITSYLIQIQGLTESGIPFVGYGNFEVR